VCFREIYINAGYLFFASRRVPHTSRYDLPVASIALFLSSGRQELHPLLFDCISSFIDLHLHRHRRASTSLIVDVDAMGRMVASSLSCGRSRLGGTDLTVRGLAVQIVLESPYR
jgi:hypothetical protein